jgi:hypothetical protein
VKIFLQPPKRSEAMNPAATQFFQENAAALGQTRNNVPNGTARAARLAASDMLGDPKTTHVWLDAGLSRPDFRRLNIITDRALCAWSIVISACVLWAAILVGTGKRIGPMEATAQMELLTRKLERTAGIPPETVSEIARITGQPWYNCGRVTCSAELQQRNSAIRAKLGDLLATKERSNDLAKSIAHFRREPAMAPMTRR